MFEEKLAGMQGFGLKGRAVGRYEPPMSNLAGQQVDETERREIPSDRRVAQIGGLGEDEPDAVVFRVLRAIAKHEHDLVADIDGETRKHGPYFGLERR